MTPRGRARVADPRPAAGLQLLYVGALPPHPNGDAIVAGQVLRGLAAAGHRVAALVPAAPDVFAGRDGPGTEDLGFAVTPYPVSHFLSSRLLGGRAAVYRQAEDEQLRRILPRFLREAGPDVVVIGRMTLCWEVLRLDRRA
jgi:hypothetical protein